MGAIPLEKLRSLHFQTFYKELIEGLRLDGKSGSLSQSSLVYNHRLIHKALDTAVKQQQQVNYMLEKARETPYYALLFLAVRTGMRRGELLALRWKDIDERQKPGGN